MNQETEIASPCIALCELDENDICKGCYRTLEQISQWGVLDSFAKEEVIKQAQERISLFARRAD